jgi:hypothetical protein
MCLLWLASLQLSQPLFLSRSSCCCCHPSTDEKRSIARRYLEPQAVTDSGVPSDAVALTDPAMDNLIDEYCR